MGWDGMGWDGGENRTGQDRTGPRTAEKTGESGAEWAQRVARGYG